MSVTGEEYHQLSDGSEPSRLVLEFSVRQPPEEEAEEIRLAQAKAIRAVLQWAREERQRMKMEVESG